ncbi:MAG: radical SAM family heme chaperone HemW [Clostridia bacterium]|nr:radical SAM family heme chaperone HemW [Clostridia bacterium]
MTASDKYILNRDLYGVRSGKTCGLYVHIPFCERKCIYCDFASYPGCGSEVIEEYFRALTAEIDGVTDYFGKNLQFETVFIGGGTPSFVDAKYIAGLLEHIPVRDGAEITMEANPGSITAEKAKIVAAAGVNRISLGVQSFKDEELRFLGRVHDSREARAAFEAVRTAGIENVNCDLIFGFPGQTQESWRYSLKTAFEMGIDHLSFYSLQIEEGTVLYDLFRRGKIDQTDEETDRGMYAEALETLKDNGFVHYEISNGAKPGRECRHNLRYWSMEDYVGVGAAAHSFVDSCRYSNPAEIRAYVDSIRNCPGESGLIDYGSLHEAVRSDRDELITDCLFTALRKGEGLNLQRFRDLFGFDVMEWLGGKADEFLRDGLLVLDDDHLRFSRMGIDISNYVLGKLI